MRKGKKYFLKMAIYKTLLTGITYLFMPVIAKIYQKYIGYEYVGYTVFGSFILITGNLILLFRAWVLAFNKDDREKYYEED